ncbi:hypothetical protein CQW23_07448 [Capsicum baccatum]|uniref:Uncharacterized protein n=1 Tax=Capsicum baccatum TaxID=33114 RepID=A0A2G2X683_CAPBA|nr:hypothetical protein CQW23_07448 [Capsicum baccatum]
MMMDKAYKEHGEQSEYYGKNAQKGSWQGFMVSDNEEKKLMFSMNRTKNTFTKLEFDIFLGDGHSEGAEADTKMKSFAFKRSDTIYKGNSIVAQYCKMSVVD